MANSSSNTLTGDDLSSIRDAVPTLDLLAIRSLRRAGFNIVRERAVEQPEPRGWARDDREVSPAA